MIRCSHPVTLLYRFVLLFLAVALPLPAQTQAEKDRINAADTAAARERAQKANPTGRFDAALDTITSLKQSDIDGAFRTKADLDFFLKQEAWRKENQQRIDFENSPAGRAKAEAAAEAAAAARRKAWDNNPIGLKGLKEAEDRIRKNSDEIRQTALKIVGHLKADAGIKLSGNDAEEAGALAEAMFTLGWFHGRRVFELNLELGLSGDDYQKLALKLYALAGGVSGRARGRLNPDHPNERPPELPMDYITPAALLKGGHGDVVVRQTRALRAITSEDGRTDMQIILGLASALAMPNSDLGPAQRTLAAELLAVQLRYIPPNKQSGLDHDPAALGWMFMAAAERTPELARAPALRPHFAAMPGGYWRTDFRLPPPVGVAATAAPATAQGNWWNLASMIVLAEKTRYPSAWFAALRAERRAKKQGPAPAESSATIQRALDDWFARNDATTEARNILRADCALACEASVAQLADSAAWDDFILSAFRAHPSSVDDQGLADLLTAPLLTKAVGTAKGDPSGLRRWLVDPRWQPSAQASLATWKAWCALAGQPGLLRLAERRPEFLRDVPLFVMALDSLKLDQIDHWTPESWTLAEALLPFTADVVDPNLIGRIAALRSYGLGDWVGLAAWMEDPRRKPADAAQWNELYAMAKRERDQVAGKLDDFKGTPDEDYDASRRFETWLRQVLAATGPARAALVAAPPDDFFARPNLQLLGGDVARGGLTSRAVLMLTTPPFSPPAPVNPSARYNPEPWLAAVAKLPPAASAEELVALLAAGVRRAAKERADGAKPNDASPTQLAGAACQRALARLAQRWSPARVPAQAAILALHADNLVTGGEAPRPNCIAARIGWERAKMQGLNSADAFARVRPFLRPEDLKYIVEVDVGPSDTALLRLVLGSDDQFFQAARRALADTGPNETGTRFQGALEWLVRPDNEHRLDAETRAAVQAKLATAENVTDPAIVACIARVRGDYLGDWARLATWLDDPRRRPTEDNTPFAYLYDRALCERDQTRGTPSGRPMGPVSGDRVSGQRLEEWLADVLPANAAQRSSLLENNRTLRITGCPSATADLSVLKPDLALLAYDTRPDFLASRALLLLATDEFIPSRHMRGENYDAARWLAAVAKLTPTGAAESLVNQLVAHIRIAQTRRRENQGKPTSPDVQRDLDAVGLHCQAALGRLATRWSPAREPAQAAILALGDDLLADGKFKPSAAGVAARVAWERAKMRGLDDAEAFAAIAATLSRATLQIAAESNDNFETALLLDNDHHFAREAAAALASMR